MRYKASIITYLHLPILILSSFLGCVLVPPSLFSQGTLDEVMRIDEQVNKLWRERKYAEAIPLAQQALEIRERLLSPYHQDIAISLNNLAALYRSTGQYAKA